MNPTANLIHMIYLEGIDDEEDFPWNDFVVPEPIEQTPEEEAENKRQIYSILASLKKAKLVTVKPLGGDKADVKLTPFGERQLAQWRREGGTAGFLEEED